MKGFRQLNLKFHSLTLLNKQFTFENENKNLFFSLQLAEFQKKRKKKKIPASKDVKENVSMATEQSEASLSSSGDVSYSDVSYVTSLLIG